MTKGKQNMGHRILLDKYYIQYKSLLNVRIVAMLHLARGARSAPRCEFWKKDRLFQTSMSSVECQRQLV